MLTRPATKVYYSVAGRTVLIETYEEWTVRAVSLLFGGWFLSSIPMDAFSTTDVTIRVRAGVPGPFVPKGLNSFPITHGGTCYTDDQVYYLSLNDSLIVFGDKPSEIDVWFKQLYELNFGSVTQVFSHALSPALRRCGLFEIHSAAVMPPRCTRAVMIAGPSGSGKSTLTSLLASCGWSYLSYDVLLLRETDQQIEARAFRRFFALTPKTIAAVKLERIPSSEGSKKRIEPLDHFASTQTRSAIPGTIIFPTVTHELSSRLAPLTKTETMARLLRLCPWASYDKPTSEKHLRLLGLLANSTCAFDLSAGTNILQDGKIATELLGNVIGEISLAG